MAKRYGTLPSEIVKLDADDFEFNLFVLGIGLEDEINQQKKVNAKMSRSRGRR